MPFVQHREVQHAFSSLMRGGIGPISNPYAAPGVSWHGAQNFSGGALQTGAGVFESLTWELGALPIVVTLHAHDTMACQPVSQHGDVNALCISNMRAAATLQVCTTANLLGHASI